MPGAAPQECRRPRISQGVAIPRQVREFHDPLACAFGLCLRQIRLFLAVNLDRRSKKNAVYYSKIRSTYEQDLYTALALQVNDGPINPGE